MDYERPFGHLCTADVENEGMYITVLLLLWLLLLLSVLFCHINVPFFPLPGTVFFSMTVADIRELQPPREAEKCFVS